MLMPSITTEPLDGRQHSPPTHLGDGRLAGTGLADSAKFVAPDREGDAGGGGEQMNGRANRSTRLSTFFDTS